MTSGTSTIQWLRRALLAILVLGLAGTEVELFLLKHTDGFWQLVPVGLIGTALAVVVWFALAPGVQALRALQIVMILFLLSGGAGVIQHFRGNVRDVRESNPSLAGADVYREASMGATPALAPGTMIQLALVGLAFAFRHPITSKGSEA